MTTTLASAPLQAVLDRLFGATAAQEDDQMPAPPPGLASWAEASAAELADALQDAYIPISAEAGKLLYAFIRAGRPETVVDGQTGYLGASNDALLDRLGHLLQHPELRRQMGQSARVLSEQFDWDLIIRRWEEVFTSLASQAGSTAR